MPGFLAALTKHLADRWLGLLVLPGVLWLATMLTAIILGPEHWHDLHHLVATVDGHLHGVHTAAQTGVVLVAAALLAAAAGLAAQAAGVLIGHVWLGEWPGWSVTVVEWLIRRREERFDRLATAVGLATDHRRRTQVAATRARLRGDPAARTLAQEARRAQRLEDRALARRDRICRSRPGRPTWMADHMVAAQARVAGAYGIDLAICWPRVWLLLPDGVRDEVTAPQQALDRATTLAGWGLLYVVVGMRWWPALLIGAAVCLTGWRRGRAAVAHLADIVESVIDLHVRDLAEPLGIDPPTGPLAPEIGRQLNARLRKGG